jgi:hypothetical protein
MSTGRERRAVHARLVRAEAAQACAGRTGRGQGRWSAQAFSFGLPSWTRKHRLGQGLDRPSASGIVGRTCAAVRVRQALG